MTKNLSWRPILIFFVILSYAAFIPTFSALFNFTTAPKHHYEYLTEGFLSGHLHLSVSPALDMLKLSDPYNPIQNENFRLHDASLYNNKYYLYFGPLPVITFFMPIKLLTGYYPSEALAVFCYLSLGFIIGFALLVNIKEKYFSTLAETHLILAGFLLGLATTAPFLLARPSFYEVAISAAFCAMSFALFFLFELLHSLTKKNIFLFSLFLALTVAGRPHFAVILVILLFGVAIYLLKYANNKLSSLILLFAPAISILMALACYNYLRFDSLLEFGQTYQLTAFQNSRVGWNFQRMGTSLFFYFLQPYFFSPVIDLPENYVLQPTAGVLWSTPLILFAAFIPLQIRLLTQRPLLWFLGYLALVPILMILLLAVLTGPAQRYEMDFIPYLIMLAIISMWLLYSLNLPVQWLKKLYLMFCFMAIVAISTGLILRSYSDFAKIIWGIM